MTIYSGELLGGKMCGLGVVEVFVIQLFDELVRAYLAFQQVQASAVRLAAVGWFGVTFFIADEAVQTAFDVGFSIGCHLSAPCMKQRVRPGSSTLDSRRIGRPATGQGIRGRWQDSPYARYQRGNRRPAELGRPGRWRIRAPLSWEGKNPSSGRFGQSRARASPASGCTTAYARRLRQFWRASECCTNLRYRTSGTSARCRGP